MGLTTRTRPTRANEHDCACAAQHKPAHCFEARRAAGARTHSIEDLSIIQASPEGTFRMKVSSSIINLPGLCFSSHSLMCLAVVLVALHCTWTSSASSIPRNLYTWPTTSTPRLAQWRRPSRVRSPLAHCKYQQRPCHQRPNTLITTSARQGDNSSYQLLSAINSYNQLLSAINSYYQLLSAIIRCHQLASSVIRLAASVCLRAQASGMQVQSAAR